MKTISLDLEHAIYFAGKEKYESLAPAAVEAIAKLDNGTGEGADFLGWTTLPGEIDDAQIDAINATAKRLRENCDYVVCVGIGLTLISLLVTLFTRN